MKQPGVTKIFMVDDHPIILFGVGEQLNMSGFCKIVGEAGNNREAEAQIKRLNPDLVIVDISLGKDSGIDLIMVLRRDLPKLKILVYTMHDNIEYVVSLLKLGISGYVLKTDPPEELLLAIKSARDGVMHLSQKITDSLRFKKSFEAKNEFNNNLHTLTGRELETLKHIATGCRNKQIAELMNCSIRTIEGYRESLMEKLDIYTVAELTILAVKEHIIDMDNFTPR
ncbi:MAG: response regulator [Bacteroidota bacterium]